MARMNKKQFQELLILCYIAEYKDISFSELSETLGMSLDTLYEHFEYYLKHQYILINNQKLFELTLSGKEILKQNNLDKFTFQKKVITSNKFKDTNVLKIDDIYLPKNFKNKV